MGDSHHWLGATLPWLPMSQLRAVGGLRTRKAGATQFQTAMYAPAQPWPLPIHCRSWIAIWAETLSYRPPTDQR